VGHVAEQLGGRRFGLAVKIFGQVRPPLYIYCQGSVHLPVVIPPHAWQWQLLTRTPLSESIGRSTPAVDDAAANSPQ